MRSATDLHNPNRPPPALGGRCLAILAAGLWLLAPCLADEGSHAKLTDSQVDQALRNGIGYLVNQPRSAGRFETPSVSRHPGSVEALVLLTVLKTGDSASADRVKDVLNHLAGIDPRTVRTRALRTMVYAHLDPNTYGQALQEDVKWLIAHKRGGGWGYGPGHPTTSIRPGWIDNDNTQLALHALYEADAAGAAVPPAAMLLPATLAFAHVGLKLGNRIPKHRLRQVAFALLLVVALSAILF